MHGLLPAPSPVAGERQAGSAPAARGAPADAATVVAALSAWWLIDSLAVALIAGIGGLVLAPDIARWLRWLASGASGIGILLALAALAATLGLLAMLIANAAGT